MLASRADSERALAAWFGVVAIWSTTPITIKWTAEGLGPELALVGRTLIGASVFLLFFLLPGMRFDHAPRVWRAGAVVATAYSVGMLLAYRSAPLIPSGLLSVVFGLSPLATALLAAFVWRSEPLGAWKALGTLLGFAGVALIFGGGGELGPGALRGLLLASSAMLINCLNLLTIKRIGREIPVTSLTAASVWLSAPAVTLIWWSSGGAVPTQVASRALWSLAWLGVAGSVFGFLLFYYALKHMSATRVALITLVTPVTSLAIGHTFNAERLPPSVAAGTALIIAGIALATQFDRGVRLDFARRQR